MVVAGLAFLEENVLGVHRKDWAVERLALQVAFFQLFVLLSWLWGRVLLLPLVLLLARVVVFLFCLGSFFSRRLRFRLICLAHRLLRCGLFLRLILVLWFCWDRFLFGRSILDLFGAFSFRIFPLFLRVLELNLLGRTPTVD